tara:strand:+ start:10158 stop:10748 length:591 start_codon:yes stop_codon:yes gene_type:complete
MSIAKYKIIPNMIKKHSELFTNKKKVFGIRHGEAWHNVLYPIIGNKAYNDFNDTTLTVHGIYQCTETEPPTVDVVLVSPLMRTLQTASFMFPNTKKIALECLKEYPQHTDLCNKRSNTSFLTKIWPEINFEDLKEDSPWPSNVTGESNLKELMDIINESDYTSIAVVTHSTWLKYWLTGKTETEPELQHCVPYQLN